MSLAELRACTESSIRRDGIITATRLLYLCIPVSAFTAEIRALKSAGGCHGPQGYGIDVGNIIYLLEKQHNDSYMKAFKGLKK